MTIQKLSSLAPAALALVTDVRNSELRFSKTHGSFDDQLFTRPVDVHQPAARQEYLAYAQTIKAFEHCANKLWAPIADEVTALRKATLLSVKAAARLERLERTHEAKVERTCNPKRREAARLRYFRAEHAARAKQRAERLAKVNAHFGK